MTKEMFLKTLNRKLQSLPKEERESAVLFYKDYFEDAENEELALSKLASPNEIAANLLIEFGEKNKHLSVGAIVLAVVTAPITLPLGFAGICIIIALVMVLFAIIISLFSVVFSIFMVGISSLIAIIPAFIFNVQTGFVFLGITLIALPISYFILIFCIEIVKKLLNLIKNASMKLLKRRYKNEK